MLRIHHEESAQTPTKAYADACWANNPRLSPDWWRELLGHTIGKVALDARTQLPNLALLEQGCNLVLATPQTWPAIHPHLTPAHVSAVVIDNLDSLPTPLPTWLIWNGEPNPATLLFLENIVKDGIIEIYGIVLNETPLHTWLELAAEASAQTWGRKKRPALKVVLGTLDLLNLSLLTSPTTRHKEEPVSPLELAARLSLAAIITPAALPTETAPPPTALQALTEAAAAEQNLHQTLQGWPTVQEIKLFNVLEPLSQGLSPWPTPHHWQSWLVHIRPELQTYWNTLRDPVTDASITTYLAALQALQPHGEALSRAAAQPLLEHIVEILQPRLPEAWRTQSPLLQNLAILTSIPGIGAIAVQENFNPLPLQQLGDIPDIAPILTT